LQIRNRNFGLKQALFLQDGNTITMEICLILIQKPGLLPEDFIVSTIFLGHVNLQVEFLYQLKGAKTLIAYYPDSFHTVHMVMVAMVKIT